MRYYSIIGAILLVMAWMLFSVNSTAPPASRSLPHGVKRPTEAELHAMESRAMYQVSEDSLRSTAAISPRLISQILVRCSGKPVPGAHLFTTSNLNRSFFIVSESIGESDDDGRIRVPPEFARTHMEETSHLVVAHEALSSATVGSPDADGIATVDLELLLTIRVRCLATDTDLPISGARVVASHIQAPLADEVYTQRTLPGPSLDWRTACASTDEHGVAELRGIMPGTYNYCIHAPGNYHLVDGPRSLMAGKGDAECRFSPAYGLAFACEDAHWIEYTFESEKLPRQKGHALLLAREIDLRDAATSKFGHSDAYAVALTITNKQEGPKITFHGVDSNGNRYKAIRQLKPLKNRLPDVELLTKEDIIGHTKLSKVYLSFFNMAGKPVQVSDISLTSLPDYKKTTANTLGHRHELLVPEGEYRLDSSAYPIAIALPRHTLRIGDSSPQEIRVDMQQVPTRISWRIGLASADEPRLMFLEVQGQDGRNILARLTSASGHEWLPPGSYTLKFQIGKAVSVHNITVSNQEEIELTGILEVNGKSNIPTPR
jgi:hypothetical protein